MFDGKADVVDLVYRCMQYWPAGDVIAAGDDDGRIHFICAQTGEKILCPLRVDDAVSSVAYSPDGSKLAAAHRTSVSIFNVETSEVLCTVRGHRYAPSLSKESFLYCC